MSTYLGNSKVSPTISGDIQVKYAFTDDGSVGGDVSNVKSVSVNGAPLGDGQTRFYVEVVDGETVTLQVGSSAGSSSSIKRVFSVDWGDGTIEEFVHGAYQTSFPAFTSGLTKTHTYTTAGKYAIVPIDKGDAVNRYRFGIKGSNNTTGQNNQIVSAEIGFNKNGDAILGTEGFQYCGSLKKVYLNDGVTTIPNYCFAYNRANLTINWLDSITTVGNSAFNTGTTSLSVNFTNFSCKNLTSVGESAFSSSSITEAVFEQPDCTIGSNAFQNCKQLKKIYFPRNITKIPGGVCYNCNGGLEIDMPDTVTIIDGSAFYYSRGASIKKLPSNLIKIDNFAFGGNVVSEVTPDSRFVDFNGITTLPDTVTTINLYAFRNAANLFLTKLPDSLTTLGDNAFDSTEIAITSIPSGVTSIPKYCFRYCPNITNITLHANITNIDTNAFYSCSNLESVTVLATTPPTLGNNVFFNNKTSRKIYVPAASLNAYKSATNWSSYASSMEAIPT